MIDALHEAPHSSLIAYLFILTRAVKAVSDPIPVLTHSFQPLRSAHDTHHLLPPLKSEVRGSWGVSPF